MLTLEDLGKALDDRSLNLQVHVGSDWVVWLHAVDDPALGAFVGQGLTLEIAIVKALAAWDHADAKEQPEPGCAPRNN